MTTATRPIRLLAPLCRCPACGELGYHLLGEIDSDAYKNTRVIARQCRECREEWTESVDEDVWSATPPTGRHVALMVDQRVEPVGYLDDSGSLAWEAMRRLPIVLACKPPRMAIDCGDTQHAIQVGHPCAPRIDLVTVRPNGLPFVVTGTPAVTPVRPFRPSADLLAEVRIAPTTRAITQSDIVDIRGIPAW